MDAEQIARQLYFSVAQNCCRSFWAWGNFIDLLFDYFTIWHPEGFTIWKSSGDAANKLIRFKDGALTSYSVNLERITAWFQRGNFYALATG